ncbi:hypothetical protein, partial [Alcaligenes faecalis]|uniref:hypothetical protein n=1 Tax=Alcaligenes faecalis TaxID=511 RepID=UPI001E2E42A7
LDLNKKIVHQEKAIKQHTDYIFSASREITERLSMDSTRWKRIQNKNAAPTFPSLALSSL